MKNILRANQHPSFALELNLYELKLESTKKVLLQQVLKKNVLTKIIEIKRLLTKSYFGWVPFFLSF